MGKETMKNLKAFQYKKRNEKLKKSGYETYQEFLKSDMWKRIKMKWLERASYKEIWRKCHCCKEEGVGLILHHTKYRQFDKPSLLGVVPVCRKCHEGIHNYHNIHPSISIKSATRRWTRRLLKNKTETYE